MNGEKIIKQGSEDWRQRYARRREQNLCVKCEEPAAKGVDGHFLVLCQKHRESDMIGRKKRIEKRIESKQCVRCKSKTTGIGVVCQECLAKEASHGRCTYCMGKIKENAKYLTVSVEGADDRIPIVYKLMCHDNGICPNRAYSKILQFCVNEWGR